MSATAIPTAIRTRATCRALDPETSKGLVTDVCLKRKIRNYVEMTKGNEAPFEIYVREKAVLNLQNQRAHDALGEMDKKADKNTSGRVNGCAGIFSMFARSAQSCPPA